MIEVHRFTSRARQRDRTRTSSILQEKGGERLLPIWIGQPEAESIVVHMQRRHEARGRSPTTSAQSSSSAWARELRRVQITRVEKGTYFAELHILRGERRRA